MGALRIKTRSEQKAEWLNAERAVRPLSEAEWQELARAEHAIYCRNWRQQKLDQDKRENAELLKRVLAESRLPVP
jgi:formylglycine-generating enzyme required for sulfatase activity